METTFLLTNETITLGPAPPWSDQVWRGQSTSPTPGSDIVNELDADGFVIVDKDAGKDNDGVIKDAVRPLADRIVYLMNRTSELLVCDSDKSLRLVIARLKSLSLTLALVVVETGIIHLSDDLEPWKRAKLWAEAQVLQSKSGWHSSQKFCEFGTTKPTTKPFGTLGHAKIRDDGDGIGELPQGWL